MDIEKEIKVAVDHLPNRPQAVPPAERKFRPDFKPQKAALRNAIIQAHRALGPGPWTEVDDTVLDMVTSWLIDVEGRRS